MLITQFTKIRPSGSFRGVGLHIWNWISGSAGDGCIENKESNRKESGFGQKIVRMQISFSIVMMNGLGSSGSRSKTGTRLIYFSLTSVNLNWPKLVHSDCSISPVFYVMHVFPKHQTVSFGHLLDMVIVGIANHIGDPRVTPRGPFSDISNPFTFRPIFRPKVVVVTSH
jgi:hypothetical protein